MEKTIFRLSWSRIDVLITKSVYLEWYLNYRPIIKKSNNRHIKELLKLSNKSKFWVT